MPFRPSHPLQLVALVAPALCTLACSLSSGSNSTIDLEGIHNFREVAGYRSSDGRVIRSGVLYRSADLGDMTPHDRDKLQKLGIRYEIDLRGPGELKERPSPWGPNPPVSSYPFPAINARPGESYDELYTDLITSLGPNIGAALKQLEHNDGPTLLHCAAGNDRTGITVAVLMKVLNIPGAQIDQEYERSNKYWGSRAGREDMRRRTHGASNGAWDDIQGKYMDNMFHVVDQRYASFEAFTRDQLKMTAEDVEQLRSKFLQ